MANGAFAPAEHEDLDVYVWVKGVDQFQIAYLRTLVTPLEGDPQTQEERQQLFTDALAAADEGSKWVVREVRVISGAYDVLVCLTANSFEDFQKFLFTQIRTPTDPDVRPIVDTESAISLSPEPAVAGRGIPAPLGPVWQDVPPYLAFVRIWVQAGRLNAVRAAIMARFPEGHETELLGLAAIGGDHDMLVELGAGSFMDPRRGLLVDLASVAGIAQRSVSFSFIPEP